MISVYITVKSKKLSNDFCSCIDKSGFAKVIDTFHTLNECKKKLAVRMPHILLLGLDLTDGYWVDFCTKIKEDYPALKILAITSYDEYCVFKNVLNSLTSGYISKDALPNVILSSLRAAMDGSFIRYNKIVVPKETDKSDFEKPLSIIQETVKGIESDNNHQEVIEKLTMMIDAAEQYRRMKITDLFNDRKDELESDLLDHYLKISIENLLVKGCSNWDIAEMLNINIETVRIYRMEFIINISGQHSMILKNKNNQESIPLGRREQQMLRLIAAGYTYKEIAEDILYVHIETVNTITDNLRRKFNAKNAMIMVIKALRMGLLKIEDIETFSS